MAYPYISGAGNLVQMVRHLRKTFPSTINSDTVKKLGLASNNESYIINALQFIGLIDEDGKKTAEGTKVFSNHRDEDFSKSFETLIKKGYAALFELHGENSWALSDDVLVTFFRNSDSTSDAIGKRQASTFKAYSALCGHGEVTARNSKPKAKAEPKSKEKAGKKTVKVAPPKDQIPFSQNGSTNVGLTVRVEVNLPSGGTKETYDNIFKSIKENLLNG
ncbi:MAG: DUF5343 domain-containing protein [Bacteroidetes bacterium]|nr:DUF5343 domain-containing protein [Bacteroidota bacterium]MBI3483418.1 DUF5343 domain-containing protein [Bacteroidota bacterium]